MDKGPYVDMDELSEATFTDPLPMLDEDQQLIRDLVDSVRALRKTISTEFGGIQFLLFLIFLATCAQG